MSWVKYARIVFILYYLGGGLRFELFVLLNRNTYSLIKCLFLACCLIGLYFGPDDGSSKLIRNVSVRPDYTASHPRR
jgi:hypothetical protein